MKHSLARTFAAVGLLWSASVRAAKWTERYSGLGSDQDRESACASAERDARSLALAACGLTGRKLDDAVDCRCNSLRVGDGELYMCTVRLQVYCAK